MINAIDKTSRSKVKLTVSINGKTKEGTAEYKQDETLTKVILYLYVELEKRMK